MDIVVHNQALIREVINGFTMVLCLTLAIMIAVFMWDTFVEYSEKRFRELIGSSNRTWSHAPGVPTACALWWIFAAEAYRTGAVWTLYQLGKRENDNGAFFATAGYFTSYGYLLAGIALIGGLLRAIYIFTPPEWKSKAWIYAAVGAAIFVSFPSIVSLLLRIYINGF